MNLIDALKGINNDSQTGVYAELIDGGLRESSEARYGQSCFENGGILDDKVYVCNGDQANYHLAEWEDDDGELVNGWFDEFIDPINEAEEYAI